jgi:hypothetical protein
MLLDKIGGDQSRFQTRDLGWGNPWLPSSKGRTLAALPPCTDPAPGFSSPLSLPAINNDSQIKGRPAGILNSGELEFGVQNSGSHVQTFESMFIFLQIQFFLRDP